MWISGEGAFHAEDRDSSMGDHLCYVLEWTWRQFGYFIKEELSADLQKQSG